MIITVKCVDDESRFGEEFWLSRKAVWSQLTGEVVYHYLRRGLPSCEHGGENLVPALCMRNAVETVRNRMCAPGHHQPSSLLVFPIRAVVLAAIVAFSLVC